MKKTDLNHFRTILQGLAERMQSHASTLSEETRSASGGKEAGELTNAPLHLGDMGTQEYLHGLNATFLENETYLVNEVAAALNRLESGVFGVCESCGEQIPKARMEAIPYARFCVACAERVGSGAEVNLNQGRPQGPPDTLAPEGDMNEDGHGEEDELDGFSVPAPGRRGDVFAAGTAGGGTSLGGLAGSNRGHGDPDVADVNASTGSGATDVRRIRREARSPAPRAGRSGGAVGGTPARKRAK